MAEAQSKLDTSVDFDISSKTPQTKYKIAGTLVGQHTIQSGDTLSAIADKLGLALDAILNVNPGVKPEDLEVGQVINLPSKKGGIVFNLNDVAKVLGVSAEALQALNAGIAQNLTIGEVINAPAAGSPPSTPPPDDIPGATEGTNGGGGFVNYGGPASQFPDPSQWQKYPLLWKTNSGLMKFNDSDSEIALIKSSIETVAQESGVDVRVILCIIMQESGGNVRVGTTDNGVRNPGIMQSHNGVAFNPSNPAGSILQMVRDGTTGTKDGDGLKQCFQHQGNWYAAFREYNSGQVNTNDLNDPVGATPGYVKDTANRLMGHIWDGM
jgi:LysM repeat protein